MRQIVTGLVGAMIALAIASGCEPPGPARSPAERSEKFGIQTTRESPADGVVATFTRGGVTLDVRNSFGIGSAQVARPADGWPANVVLRLHLQGLESLKISTGTAELSVSVSSHGGEPVSASLRRGGDGERELAANDPAWPRVRMVGDDGRLKSGIPLVDGCFEIEAPRALFEGDPAALTLRWIDFFRN